MDERIKKDLELIKQGVLETVPAEAIYLFGSHAYGTPQEDSDLDIFVVIPDSVKKRPLDVGADILCKLYEKQKPITSVDIVVNPSSMFYRRKEGPTLQRTIAQKGVKLYGL